MRAPSAPSSADHAEGHGGTVAVIQQFGAAAWP